MLRCNMLNKNYKFCGTHAFLPLDPLPKISSIELKQKQECPPLQGTCIKAPIFIQVPAVWRGTGMAGEGTHSISMNVNGRKVTGTVEPRTLLAQFLRENLRLTGTHIGCDTSQCGACLVHADGLAIKSCTALAVMYDGASITTIEGLAAGQDLHPMQAAFREHHGLQCGFCTPGMIMSAIDMVNRLGHDLDEHTIRHELEGNICRCTGYHNIVKAIQSGAKAMQAGARA